MWFGTLALDESAVGAVLVHTHRLPGRVMRKGVPLTEAGIGALREAGFESVVAARLEPGDIDEDAAADRIARAAAGPGLHLSKSLTGRCNLHAMVRGVFRVDRARVDALNQHGWELTLGTAAPDKVVEPGELLATVKVIPFAVADGLLRAVEAAAAEPQPLLALAPLRPHSAALVLSRQPRAVESLLTRAEQVQRTRLSALGSTLDRVEECAHTESSVAEALRACLDAGHDPVLFLGASAIVDTRDVFPAALRAIGGVVEHVGMPVDPGNLMVMGRHGDRTVIGVPGCARSLKPSGFDRVLRRRLADLPVDADFIQRLGVGGLMLESTGAGPAPRPPSPDGTHSVAALVLAAGCSSRMGARHKLLEPIDGTPMVRRTVERLTEAGLSPVVVVTGHGAADVRAVLGGLPCRFAHNPGFAEGMGTSLAVGAAAVSGVDAVLVALADMPDVSSEHVGLLLDAWHRSSASIVVPFAEGRRGNPVLFSAEHLPALRQCTGDVGARALVELEPARVEVVPIEHVGILRDIDTPDDLAARRAVSPE
ncbi:MAG TPA: 4-diphosphocytidyl-2C-methyl-D-erythritol kinase [Deltaproteobacteria bacterium]|nr:4-diphosphocytidyl-2C-methyl-D-erythritol kinase [Deltaproteobacteria bacterium]